MTSICKIAHQEFQNHVKLLLKLVGGLERFYFSMCWE